MPDPGQPLLDGGGLSGGNVPEVEVAEAHRGYYKGLRVSSGQGWRAVKSSVASSKTDMVVASHLRHDAVMFSSI